MSILLLITSKCRIPFANTLKKGVWVEWPRFSGSHVEEETSHQEVHRWLALKWEISTLAKGIREHEIFGSI